MRPSAKNSRTQKVERESLDVATVSSRPARTASNCDKDRESQSHDTGERWSSIEKFTADIECESLTPRQRIVYCQQAEISVETIAVWRRECVKAEFWKSEGGKRRQAIVQEAMEYIGVLEKELLENGENLMEAWAFLTSVKKALLTAHRSRNERKINESNR